MNAFQKALQNKAAALQASIVSKVPQSPQAAALDQKFQAAGVPIAPSSDLPADPIPDLITISIDRVVNKNRIDVFFSSKPSQAVRDDLKRNNWWFRPSDSGWENTDNETNRKYCELNFGADFGTEDDSAVHATNNADDTDRDYIRATLTANHTEPEAAAPIVDEVSPEFAKFRLQTNELLAELKIEAADLMLLAIDALHKQTFSRDS